jgi:hypothetical protein
MKNISINIELSQMALETVGHTMTPGEMLQKARLRLNSKLQQLGGFVNCQLSEKRTIGNDLNVESYDLRYENQTLRMRFAQLQARGTWEMQGFQWV